MGFLAERLRSQTSDLADLLTRRIRELTNRENLLPCIRQYRGFNPEASFLEPGEYAAVGIDGSMDYDELLEMLLFYVCATGFRCSFTVDREIRFHLNEIERDQRLAASASVPLWTEDLFQVADDESMEQDLGRSAERIPFALMTMAELYLALKAVDDETVRLIFLDRPLSGTFAPLSRDLRFFLSRGKSPLLGVETSYGPVTLLDFKLVSVLGSGNDWVSKRPQYLPYLAVQTLLKAKSLSHKELYKRLGISEKEGKRLLKKLKRMHKDSGGRLFVDDPLKEDAPLTLQENVKYYWPRVKEVAFSIAERVFSSSEHPLMVDKGETWLTVIDLNTINAVLIRILKEKAQERGVLVVGIAKDTSASEFLRAVIPYAKVKGLIPPDERLPNLKHDRAFLTILSSTNPSLFKAPWRTIGYDSCFTTLIQGDGDVPLRAARRAVSLERQFVRGYFQLREFESDGAVRSPTFLYDRFYNPEVDERFVVEITVRERGRKVKIYPYWEGAEENPLDSFILCLLSKCDNPEIIEAIGHNQLLYIADKAVKNEIKMMKGLLRGVADLELGSLSRKQKIFTIARRFRDIRRETEGAREKAALEEI